MLKRIPLLVVAAFIPLLWVSAASADEKAGTDDGKIVKAGDGKLTMVDKEGKNEHTHAVPVSAKVTCDGKDCKLDDLKKDTKVKVTVEKVGDKNTVTKIEATSP